MKKTYYKYYEYMNIAEEGKPCEWDFLKEYRYRDARDIKEFWSEITGRPLEHFSHSFGHFKPFAIVSSDYKYRYEFYKEADE